MKKYDDIVIGSGISGLTMALLLGMHGHRVLLLEKAPHIGGSLSRFRRRGVAFDTGFHFTGGLHAGGILTDILSFLGIRDFIEPIFVGESYRNRFIFSSSNREFDHPSGIENIKKSLKGYFPGETSGIDRYFEKIQSVCQRTPALNIHNNTITPPNLDEDYISLDSVLKDMTSNLLLRGLLSGYVMCYGVRPDEISFANHSRMVLSFYESLACVKNGGDAFVHAFEQKFKEYNVEVQCGTTIREFADIQNCIVKRFVLSTGEEIAADSCILAIHPKEILKMLPEKHFSKAFADRITSFESSIGIFTAFGMLKPDARDPYPDSGITSIFPNDDVNYLLDPAYQGDPAQVIIKLVDEKDEKKGICILEPSFPEEVMHWKDTQRGSRPQEYLDYKKHRIEAMKKYLLNVFPLYQDNLEIVDSASILTFKEYLNSPDGSAYGIKQKMGQFNLIGKLPLHNVFATGQSALLPGIIGAMMSSLIVGRAVIGKGRYGKLLSQTVCHSNG
ncbi:MAG: NAD(P)/FAD-dependent oxidoreductase [Nitrospirota bacterium]